MAVVMALAACGGSSEPGHAGIGPGLAPDDYQAAWRAAQCARFVRCGLYGSMDTCVESRWLFGTALGHPDQVAGHAGKLYWDGEAAQACVDAIAASSCDRTSENLRTSDATESCLNIVTGFTPPGDSCEMWEACQSGYCEQSDCTPGTCCEGTCSEVVATPFHLPIGSACEATYNCASGGWCQGSAGDGTYRGTCVALRAANELCRTTEECAYGLACADSVCHSLPTLGEACALDCRDVGTVCVGGRCTAFATEGQACGLTARCATVDPGFSVDLFECDATGHCSRGSDTGSSCSSPYDCAEIADHCIANACQPGAQNGAPCSAATAESCDSYYCEDGQCADYPVCY